MRSDRRWLTLSLLCGLFLAAAIIRGTALVEDQLFFADEGHYLQEARFLIGQGGGQALLYAKPLYSGLLSVSLLIGGNRIVVAQIFQALIASLWIPMIFLLIRRLGLSERVAWITSVLAVFEPWSVVYARHLFPDPLAGLFWMIAMGFLLKCPRKPSTLLLSGLAFGISLGGQYRMMLFGPGMILALVWGSEGSFRDRLEEVVIWLSAILAPLMGLHILYEFFRVEGTATFFQQLIQITLFHSRFGLKTSSATTYPFLLAHYGGPLLIVSLAIGLLFFLKVVSKPGQRIFLCTYCLSLFLFAFSYFPFARIWAPLLFWHPILMASGVDGMSRWGCRRHLRVVPVLSWVLAGLIIASFIPRLLLIRQASIPYHQAIQWIQERGGESSPLLVTLPVLLGQILPSWRIEPLVRIKEWESIEDLKGMGFRFVLLDPYQYTRPAESLAIEREINAARLAQLCQPQLKLECPNVMAFWDQFAWEHNVDVSRTRDFLQGGIPKNSPCVEVYDLERCKEEKLDPAENRRPSASGIFSAPSQPS